MNKTFSINELAGECALPRSTVIDWLERYSDYFHYQMKGKRKLYEENSPDILREIAALREKSVPAHEIERLLAKSHALRPEVAEFEKEAPSALSIRNHEQQMAGDIARHFQTISENVADMKKQYNSLFKRGLRQTLIYTAMALFCFCALLGFVFIFQQYAASQQQNKMIADKNTRNELTIADLQQQLEYREKQMNKLVVSLDKTSKSYRANIVILRRQIAEQQRAFEQAIAEAKKAGARDQAMENAILKNEFARKRLELLEKIEALSSRLSDREKLIDSLHKQNASQTETIKKLLTKTEGSSAEPPQEKGKK